MFLEKKTHQVHINKAPCKDYKNIILLKNKQKLLFHMSLWKHFTIQKSIITNEWNFHKGIITQMFL
jgi:hypothetical protein